MKFHTFSLPGNPKKKRANVEGRFYRPALYGTLLVLLILLKVLLILEIFEHS